MKRIMSIAISLFVASNLFAQKLATENDSVAYVIGTLQATLFANELKSMDLPIASLAQGFNDAISNNDKALFTSDQTEEILKNYFGKKQQAEEAKMQEKCLENSDFLQANKNNKDVVTLENGLQYKVVTKGKSDVKPTENDQVKVHYKGSLIDGKVFDSSLERNEPVIFPVQAVIPGFSQILQLMTVGSTYIAFIPSELGYGMQDMGVIPPCSTLIFEIQLIDVIKDTETPTVDDNATNDDKASKKAKKSKK